MLFFRSEELVKAWCQARGITPRPLVTMRQLWELAVAWYGTRLSAEARRPAPAEIRHIFARIGLNDLFWDPQADAFGQVGISTPETFTHAIVSKGGTTVFIAGQVAEDSAGNLIGAGDMVAQSRQVFANIGRCLEAAGTRPDQVTKITIFVANYTRDHLPMIEEGRVSLFGDHKPADTLVGVAALSRSGYMLEVDAIAVIEEGE